MDTKETIEKLESMRIEATTIDSIQQLLRIGEIYKKYKEMWEDFKKEYGFMQYEDLRHVRPLRDLMDIFKEKYFPIPQKSKIIKYEIEVDNDIEMKVVNSLEKKLIDLDVSYRRNVDEGKLEYI